MARPDPILDSEAFTDALAIICLSDYEIYRATVLYFFHGLSFQEISKEMGRSRNTIAGWINKSKDVIRDSLKKTRPELLDVSALREKQAEDLARGEIDEINRRFPFTRKNPL